MGGTGDEVWSFDVEFQTVSSLRLEGEGRSIVVALVFHEGLADEIASLLNSFLVRPDGVQVVSRLETVHPDELESWIR